MNLPLITSLKNYTPPFILMGTEGGAVKEAFPFALLKLWRF
jgi:hypothetical protein